jgi:cephalosporin hydroxylase
LRVAAKFADTVRAEGLGAALYKSLDYSRMTTEAVAAAGLVKVRRRGVRTPKEIAEFADHFRFGRIGIAPFQVRSEFEALLEVVAAATPDTVFEIGTGSGGTLFGFAALASRHALLITIDLPEGKFGGGYHQAQAHVLRGFAREGQRIELLRANSHDPATIKHVRTLVEGRPIDFLFIDGDHSYRGVRDDFELYAPLVRPGGLIALHDIVPGPEELVGGVPRFWRELSAHYETRELVRDNAYDGYGIGLITVPAPHG